MLQVGWSNGHGRRETGDYESGLVVVVLQLIKSAPVFPDGIFEGQRAGPRSDEGNSGNTEFVAQIRYPSQHNITDDAERRSRELL
jgi:hypothetical protein